MDAFFSDKINVIIKNSKKSESYIKMSTNKRFSNFFFKEAEFSGMGLPKRESALNFSFSNPSHVFIWLELNSKDLRLINESNPSILLI